MCTASSHIQDQWKPSKGDYYFDKEEKKVFLLTAKSSKKGKVWLPTEYQLHKLGIKYGILNWMKFDQECTQFWNYFTKMYNEHPSKKMCGLAVVMTLAENKYWRDESWK